MGRNEPSYRAPPPAHRKEARAKRAKQTLNRDIPALLRSYQPARNGIEASELLINPGPAAHRGPPLRDRKSSSATTTYEESASMDPSSSGTALGSKQHPLTIRVQCADTLEAAAELYKAAKQHNRKALRVGVLNMASPLRPGGGFLNGATSQEESLCMRTTLLPALKEEYYRLPEIGGIYTPNVLVFRSHDAEATDLPKNKRFFIDVITAAMHRMPDTEEDDRGERRYANPKDRDAAEQKVRAVMRIAKSKGISKLVFGAWGCGAYANPVNEILTAFRNVLREGQVASPAGPSWVGRESWEDLDVVFAIKDQSIANQFAEQFGVGCEVSPATSCEPGNDGDKAEDDELDSRIMQLESQIAAARSQLLRDRLAATLEKLKVSANSTDN